MTLNILGIDPGSRAANPTGAALLRIDGSSFVVSQVYTIKPSKRGDWEGRIYGIVAGLADIIYGLPLDAVAVESPVLARHSRDDGYGGRIEQDNPESIAPLWAIFGAVLYACGLRDMRVVRVNPIQAKSALVGPRATKEAMQARASALVGKEVSSHEADAIGIALAADVILRAEERNRLMPAFPKRLR